MTRRINSSMLRDCLRRCGKWAEDAEIRSSEECTRRAEVDFEGRLSEMQGELTSFALTAHKGKALGRFSRAFSKWPEAQDFLESNWPPPLQCTLEKARYSLNGPQKYRELSPEREDLSSMKTVSDMTLGMRDRLAKEWPHLKISSSLSYRTETVSLENSLGLSGSYDRGQIRAAFHFWNEKTKRLENVYLKHLDSEESVLAECRKKLDHMSTSLPCIQVTKGTSSLLLSPWIVEMICLGVASAVSVDSKETPQALEQLPLSFCLEDDPFLLRGLRKAPFDDEGTPTFKKTLCVGPEVKSRLSHLESAARNQSKSSGNGFRRSRFLEGAYELSPRILPTNLVLRAGTQTLSDVLKEHDQVILLEQMIFPLSKIDEFVSRSVAMCFEGKVYKDGRVAALLSGQRHPSARRVAKVGKAHGSLLDKSAVPLKTGQMTSSGWFPYVFLPRFTWG